MTTIPTTRPTTGGVPVPAVRFAALRGRVPLPWATIAALAVVLAFADGLILTIVRGAVGAIERTQTPFATWLHDSTLMLPLFVLALVWAFARIHRKHDLTSRELRRPRRILAAALLIAAAGSAVTIVELAVSTAYDYHLQSDLLAAGAAFHNHAIGANSSVNPAYADSNTWTPEQRDTAKLAVTGAGLGTGMVVGANVLLVGWVVALRGGRLDVRPRRPRTGTPD